MVATLLGFMRGPRGPRGFPGAEYNFAHRGIWLPFMPPVNAGEFVIGTTVGEGYPGGLSGFGLFRSRTGQKENGLHPGQDPTNWELIVPGATVRMTADVQFRGAWSSSDYYTFSDVVTVDGAMIDGIAYNYSAICIVEFAGFGSQPHLEPQNWKLLSKYTVSPPSGGGSTLPTGGTAGQVLKLGSDGSTLTWAADIDTNTTYPNMSATNANAGTQGTASTITAAVLRGAIRTHAVPSDAAVAIRVAVPSSGTATGAVGNYAVGGGYVYFYTGDGTTHSWVRSAATAW